MRLPRVRAGIALDGGNLLTNGQGLCLATTQLLETNRAFGYEDNCVTDTIKRLFGAEEIVYLERLEGEKTGHVDLFAAFTAPDTVVVGDYAGIDPANAAILDRNAERLSKVVTSSGPLKVVRLPMPPRGKDYFGGSYTNVLFANGVLLVPSWPNVPRETEDQVMATYRRLLPGWDVVGIDVGDLMSYGGVLRCVSLPLYRIGSMNGSARTKNQAALTRPEAAVEEAALSEKPSQSHAEAKSSARSVSPIPSGENSASRSTKIWSRKRPVEGSPAASRNGPPTVGGALRRLVADAS
jgi:hypothetical protein